MVFKNSEYRRQYKKTTLIKNIPTYYEHVNYRSHRRELECAHTPISWDWETEDTEFESVNGEKNVDEIPIEKLKIDDDDDDDIKEVEMDKKDKEKNLKDIEECDEKEEKEECDEKEENKKNSNDVIIEVKSPEQRALTKLAKAKLNKYASKENRDLPEQTKPELQKYKSSDDDLLEPKKIDDKTFIYKPKPKRPGRDRPKSSSSSRPVSAAGSSMSCDQFYRPPFCAYGGGNLTRTTGQQRTYNVKASKQVYPAAAQAHQKQLEAERKRRSAERKAFLREKRKKAALVDKIAKETASWQSEYCRNYPVYDSTEYERNVSSRAGKRKSEFIVQ